MYSPINSPNTPVGHRRMTDTGPGEGSCCFWPTNGEHATRAAAQSNVFMREPPSDTNADDWPPLSTPPYRTAPGRGSGKGHTCGQLHVPGCAAIEPKKPNPP